MINPKFTKQQAESLLSLIIAKAGGNLVNLSKAEKNAGDILNFHLYTLPARLASLRGMFGTKKNPRNPWKGMKPGEEKQVFSR